MTDQKQEVNVQVNVDMQPIVIRKQPGCLVQALYFIFIGWWLGGLAMSLAYLLMLTIVGIPAGIAIINKIPYLMALRETEPIVSYVGVQESQYNIFIRVLWFILVGWWFTAIWLSVAYILALTIIGMPLAFWMFDKAPMLLTLKK